MWIDLPGWQAQSSFVQPVAPPGTDPEAAPLVCLSFNQTWLPYVIGSLMQLVQPAAWATSDPSVLSGVLQDAQTLIQLFGAAEGCTMLTFQFTDACVLQFSLDGGTTWEDVAGWPTYAPACYTGPAGPTGPTGPAGGFTPGIPPIQPGQTTADLACAVAGYIAQYVIQVSLSAVVNGYNTTQTALEVATGILALIPGVDVVFAAVTGAVTLLYGFVNSSTIGAFTAAESDPLLLGDLTCAIYNATSGDGYVTAANFAAVEAAIAAISYTYPAVISAISDWLDALGYDGIAAAQIPGALAVVDCSGCTVSDNAYEFDATAGTNVIMASDVDFGSGDFTVGGWLLIPVSPNFGGTLWCSGAIWPHTENGLVAWMLGGATSGRNNSCYISNSADGVAVTSDGPALDVSTPYHMVLERSGGGMYIYVNGDLVASGEAGGTLQSSSPQTNFGPPGYANWGDGAVGPNLNARLWGWGCYVGTALSSGDIGAWYAAGTFARPPGSPTHVWMFDEGSGTTVHDSAGSDDGTIANGGTWATHP